MQINGKHFVRHISMDKQERIARFVKRDDAVRALLAELLIRAIICSKLGISNSDIEFAFNEHGKPLLSGCDDFHFNLAHSGDWVVCAVDSKPVGIDIEEIKPVDMGIAEMFFAALEYQDLQKAGLDRDAYFYALWTLKESYLKAIGTGLSAELKAVPFRVRDNGGIRAHFQCGMFFKQYSISRGYILSVCSHHNAFPAEISIFTLDDLKIG